MTTTVQCSTHGERDACKVSGRCEACCATEQVARIVGGIRPTAGREFNDAVSRMLSDHCRTGVN